MNNENENKVNGTAAADNGAACVSEGALSIAENAAGVRYLFPVRSNAEIGSDTECRINGFSELWTALAGDNGAAVADLVRGALEGAVDFNLMPIGRARRSKSGVISYTTDDETPKGIMAATAFCLWVKIGTEWKLLSNVLDSVGIAIPATVALKNGRKFRNRLRKLVIKGMAQRINLMKHWRSCANCRERMRRLNQKCRRRLLSKGTANGARRVWYGRTMRTAFRRFFEVYGGIVSWRNQNLCIFSCMDCWRFGCGN